MPPLIPSPILFSVQSVFGRICRRSSIAKPHCRQIYREMLGLSCSYEKVSVHRGDKARIATQPTSIQSSSTSRKLEGTSLECDRRRVLSGFTGCLVGIVASKVDARESPLDLLSACRNFKQAGKLQYCDIKEGDGDPAEEGDLIEIDYTARTADNGVVYDGSRGFRFYVGQGEVIPGWDEGILGNGDMKPMREGGQRTVRIPADLAYGARGDGCLFGLDDSCRVPPNSDVEITFQYVSQIQHSTPIVELLHPSMHENAHHRYFHHHSVFQHSLAQTSPAQFHNMLHLSHKTAHTQACYASKAGQPIRVRSTCPRKTVAPFKTGLKWNSGVVRRQSARRLVCKAEEGEESEPEVEEVDPAPTPTPPPAAEDNGDGLGLIGNILAWGFLAFLFAGSLFFTFSRQLLPDLVPLDMQNPPI